MESNSDAQSALDHISSARQEMVAPARGETTYGIVYALVAGIFVASQGIDGVWGIFLLIVTVAALIGLIVWWQRSHGWWVSGYSPRRARWVALGMIPVLLALAAWSYLADSMWISALAGLIAAGVALAGNAVWMRVWRAEVKAEMAPSAS